MATQQSKESYVLARGLLPSTRLNYQHFVFQSELQYLLHPSIPLTPGTSVVDIGCGTAVWLWELARRHPDVTFTGVDVDISQAPAREFLPPNLTLEEFDAFGEVPDHLVGKFDVANLRFFMLVVKEENPLPLIQTALALLKPGGHVQWAEWDLNTRTYHYTTTAASPDPDTQAAHLEAFRAAATFWTSSGSHLFPQWISDLAGTLGKHFTAIREDRRRYTPMSQNYLFETIFMSFREIALHMDSEVGQRFREKVAAAEEAFVKSGRGIGSDIDSVVVVGQKAE